MISVIIPTYSPGEYIYECIDSIVHQTLSNDAFEIIIILNGPKEPYYSKINDFMNKQSPSLQFRLFYTGILGVSNARNIGIDNAKGEYITFIDDDDMISPTYLEGLLAVSSPTCIGVSNGYIFVNNINERIVYAITNLHKRVKDEKFSFIKFRTYLSSPVFKLIHKNIIGDVRFDTSMKISEDSLFCFKISVNVKEMRCAEESVIYYVREREGSATRKAMDMTYVLKLTVKKMYLFTKIYLNNPFRYNFLFYVSRLMASIKHAKRLYDDGKKYKDIKG